MLLCVTPQCAPLSRTLASKHDLWIHRLPHCSHLQCIILGDEKKVVVRCLSFQMDVSPPKLCWRTSWRLLTYTQTTSGVCLCTIVCVSGCSKRIVWPVSMYCMFWCVQPRSQWMSTWENSAADGLLPIVVLCETKVTVLPGIHLDSLHEWFCHCQLTRQQNKVGSVNKGW